MTKKNLSSMVRKKPNKLTKGLHVLTCHLTAFSLLYTPAALAQSSFAQSASDVIEGIGGIAQQVMAQKQAAQQQQQMQQMMAQFHPNNQMVPSKLFPNCQVLKARSDFPSGACENVPMLGDMMSVNQSMAFRDIADDFDNHISNLLTTNQNSPQPVGIQCIKESGAKVGEEIENRIKALEAQITMVRKSTQLFKEKNFKIKEDMNVLKGDLYGGAATNKDVNKDFLSEFSAGCSTWFGTTANDDTREKGLDGLRNLSSKINEKASNIIANQNNMTSDIVKQLDGLDDRIKQRGIAAFSDPNEIATALNISGSGQSYKVLDSLIADKTNLLRTDIDAISKDLAEVGFEMGIGDFDRNFKRNFVDFSKNAKSFFQKQAVNDCVTNNNGMGLGLSTDQILKSLRIRDVGSNQTTLTSFKDELQSILDSNAFIDKKISMIEALDKKFGVGEVYLTYTNASGNRISATTYGLYKDQIAACETQIGNTMGFGLQRSQKQKIATANEAIQKAISLERTFRNDLKQSLYDRAVNCKGIEPKQETCSYADSSVMASSGDNFCISNAVSCAGQVNTCQAEVHTVVQRKQAEMKSLASQFNANVSGIVAQQETLLNQIKSQAIADAEYLKQYFDDSDYKYPEGLFIKMPLEEMVDEYGVALRGKGDLSQIEGLPTQLEKLKKMLQNQKEKVGRSILSYTQSQKDGMVAEKKRWATLAKRCANVEKGYNQAVAEQQKAMQEQQVATGNFCRKYNRISNNPTAACGQASSLAEDASNISQAVDPNAVDLAQEFASYCDSSQNERTRGTEGDIDRRPASEEDSAVQKLVKACSIRNWDGDQINSKLESGNLGLDDEQIEDIISEYSKESFAELSGHTAEAYCKAYGRTYTEDECETTAGKAEKPNVCSYLQYNAYLLKPDDTPKVAVSEFYKSVQTGGHEIENDSMVSQVAALYSRARENSSPSGNIGERMKNTPCMAVNTNGLGESQSDSREDDLWSVIGGRSRTQ